MRASARPSESGTRTFTGDFYSEMKPQQANLLRLAWTIDTALDKCRPDVRSPRLWLPCQGLGYGQTMTGSYPEASAWPPRAALCAAVSPDSSRAWKSTAKAFRVWKESGLLRLPPRQVHTANQSLRDTVRRCFSTPSLHPVFTGRATTKQARKTNQATGRTRLPTSSNPTVAQKSLPDTNTIVMTTRI